MYLETRGSILAECRYAFCLAYKRDQRHVLEGDVLRLLVELDRLLLVRLGVPLGQYRVQRRVGVAGEVRVAVGLEHRGQVVLDRRVVVTPAAEPQAVQLAGVGQFGDLRALLAGVLDLEAEVLPEHVADRLGEDLAGGRGGVVVDVHRTGEATGLLQQLLGLGRVEVAVLAGVRAVAVDVRRDQALGRRRTGRPDRRTPSGRSPSRTRAAASGSCTGRPRRASSGNWRPSSQPSPNRRGRRS